MKYNDFIIKARKQHGTRYEYPVFDVCKSTEKVTIICKEHGVFEQNLYAHLKGQGCPKCSKNQKMTTDDFILKAKEVHGDKYDYSKTKYVNKRTKVVITCPIHGDFEVLPFHHTNGGNCKKCANENRVERPSTTKNRVYDTTSFIVKAKEVHGDKYDYSKVNYIDTNTKVVIICPEHGEFKQTPNSHLMNHGCPTCSKNKKLDLKSFIAKAKEVHGYKYDYSTVNFNNSNDNITIICPEHGEFEQNVSHHLSGVGCPKCAKNKVLTTEEFIERAKQIHGDKYDYSKVNYINLTTPVIIICPEHGEFEQSPNNHLSGNGCSKCNESKLERGVSLLLEQNQVRYIPQYRAKWLGRQSLDFYIPDKNIAIECQGKQHFNNVERFGNKLEENIKLDIRKFNLCKENNVKLYYIFPNKCVDYSNVNKQEIIYTKENIIYTLTDLLNIIR